jgi:trehalose/maltose hydrolase-like predicted phosphorylase
MHRIGFRLISKSMAKIGLISTRRSFLNSGSTWISEPVYSPATIVVKDKQGRETRVVSKRMASMADPHLASLQYAITPLNYSGEITLSSGINGDIINDGVERYKQLNQQHLKPLQQGCRENLIWVSVETTQSAINIVEAANHKLFTNGEELKITGIRKT